MMAKLITYKQAKDEIIRLKNYVQLVEGYQTNTLEKMIIKEYALMNSMPKVAEKLKYLGVTREMVAIVLKSTPQDGLHKILKSGYMTKTKYSRSR
jgi:hypothetical protein